MYDVEDERGVPVSKGIPVLVRIMAVIGLLAIIAMGGIVIHDSSYGHKWPAQNSVNVPL